MPPLSDGSIAKALSEQASSEKTLFEKMTLEKVIANPLVSDDPNVLNNLKVNDAFLHNAWQRLCQQLDIHCEDYIWHSYQQLVAYYLQPQRAYHNLEHLTECLLQLEPVRHLAQQPALLELALWCHDTIYEPTQDSHDLQYNNEQQSANWAVRFLQQGQATDEIKPALDIPQHMTHKNTAHKHTAHVAKQTISPAKQNNQTVLQTLEQLIMATKHHQASTPDEQFMVDIDLAILASKPSRFARYEQQIRFEYQFVPQEVFVLKRREVLLQFYQRERIYQSDYFYQHLEQAARQNLQRGLGL